MLDAKIFEYAVSVEKNSGTQVAMYKKLSVVLQWLEKILQRQTVCWKFLESTETLQDKNFNDS